VHHARFDLEDRDTFRCAAGPWILYESNDPAGTLRVSGEQDVAGGASLHDLTTREAEVVGVFLARWFDGDDSSNAAVASQLYVGVETVKTHLANVRTKWNCRSREDIARRAVEAGLLPDRPARIDRM
jgi:DNA-binding CsgD family transcriptional regulator